MANRKLSKYRAKRDFGKTAEPSGERTVATAGALRFVIQKHAARRLHYDLRLELGGVFKSWAVTRGPSLDPADKRLAVEVEDHPLDYGDFEGSIPRGEYGGGTVQLWDRGYWTPEGDRSPDESLQKGELKFTLEGDRLHGSWVLVRMKGDRYGGKRTNWLLIKHRDEAARPGDHDELLAEDRSVASGRPMAAIAAGKGRVPRPFMLAKPARRASPRAVWHSNRPDAEAAPVPKQDAATRKRPIGKHVRTRLPEFIAPQLAKLVDRPPAGPGWGHEIKLDGYRLQLRAYRGKATLKTRKGLDWTDKFGALAHAARTLPDCIVDGEVVAINEHGVPSFAALQAALGSKDADQLVFFAFDLLFLGNEDLRGLPLTDRKIRLEELLQGLTGSGAKRIRYLEHFETAGEAILRSACQIDLEGIVSKRLAAAYSSDRNGNWLKSKCRAGHEVVIGGWTSTGSALRSLIVGVYRGGDLVPVGSVGTGFGREKIGSLLKRLKSVATSASPFTGKVSLSGGRRVHWVKPELVAEIEFAGWTEGGNVRQAAFKGLREDKPAREVRAEKPTLMPLDESSARRAAQSSSGKRKRPAAAKRSLETEQHRSQRHSGGDQAAVLGVNISKPDKVLWPATQAGKAVTKRDLADYFAAVGEWMLPHVAGRPCSIIRAPDGIAGPRFFQRHAMAGMSNLLDLIKVAGDKQAYVTVNRLEGLVAIAQTAGLELHPGGCRPDEPEVPGRLVFDLDPAPDVPFTTVIQAALELRDRLAGMGLTSFCKSTGGKGLHVVTPLARLKNAKLDWAVAKAFAREVCRQVADDAPDLYVLSMAKRERTGRIFLDYLRNDRLATAVAPLSPRARVGAPVSMPLNWDEVRQGLNPARFTLHSAPALLGRSKPWKDYGSAAGSLVAAIRKLGQTGEMASNSARAPTTRRRAKRAQVRRRTPRVASASRGLSGQ